MRRLVVLSSLCLLIAGCTDHAVLVTEAGLPTGAPVMAVAVGASVPSDAPGYSISANVGGSYRVVWSSDRLDRIAGSVFTPGRFTVVDIGCAGACGSEVEVLDPVGLVGGGERVDFFATATPDLVGFDFVVDAEPAYFDLLLNDDRIPELVRFASSDLGGAPAVPPTLPFGLTGTGVIR